jgi:WD40 repeat protein
MKTSKVHLLKKFQFILIILYIAPNTIFGQILPLPVELEIAAYGSVSRKGVFGIMTRVQAPSSLSRDGKYFISFSKDGILTIWRAATGRIYKTIQSFKIPEFENKYFGGTRLVGIQEYSSVDQLLIAVDNFFKETNGIYVYDQNNKMKKKFANEENETLEGALVLNSQYLAYAGTSSLLVFSLGGKEQEPVIKLISLPSGLQGSVYTSQPGPLTFSPDGRYLAYGLANTSMGVIDIPLRRVVFSLNLSNNSDRDRPVTSLAFSPSGKLLSGGTYYGQDIFSIESGELLRSIIGANLSTFLEDSKLLVAVPKKLQKGTTAITTIRVVDMAKKDYIGAELFEFQGDVQAIEIDNDDNLIIVPSMVVRHLYRIPEISKMAMRTLQRTK